VVLEVRPRIDVEPKFKGFVVSRWLPLGLTPRPVGFMPGTERGDGDPVDAHRPKREWDVTGRNPSLHADWHGRDSGFTPRCGATWDRAVTRMRSPDREQTVSNIAGPWGSLAAGIACEQALFPSAASFR